MSPPLEKLSVEELFEPASRTPLEGNLPPEEGPLVGRDTELGEIIHHLSDPACRLLTLAGPGGIGKTRLAIEAARESLVRFSDGVHYVPLVAVRSGEFLPAALATALKITTFGQEDLKKQVAHFLREKEALLVLDNFEHLLAEADWLPALREEAPKVKFIVTSRESLGVKGEKVFHVKGLANPPDDSGQEIEKYGSVQLFLREARRAHPEYVLTEQERPYLIHLCKFLEGMPLGLRLAAVWVKTHPIEQIYGEIRKNRDFLTSLYGDVPERHRSLRAVFEHSWAMLGPTQKEILRKLSVFHGSFSVEGAEVVAGAPITQLALLTDKSVLRKAESGRYEMHPLLKQYAEEKLEESVEVKEEVCQRHCLYYAGFAKEREGWLYSPRQKEAMEDVGREIEDIRDAWKWVLEKQLIDEREKFVEVLFHYYDMHGLYQEGLSVFSSGVKVLEKEVKQADADTPKALRALYGDLMARQGRFYHRLGQTEKAQGLLRESLRILEAVGSVRQIVFAVNQVSFVLSLVSGDFKESKRLLEQAVKNCEKSNDRPSLALSLKNLGYINWRIGNYTEARQLLHRSENLYTEMGDADSLSVVLTEIVNIAFDQSRYEEAEELCLKSLKVHQEIGNRSGAAWTQGKLGNIYWVMGNYEVAKKLYDQSLKIFRETGDHEGVAWGVNSQGHVLQSMGNGHWAMESYKEGAEIYGQLNHQWGMAWSLANRGLLEILLGKREAGEASLKESLGIFKEIGNPWGMSLVLDAMGTAAIRRQGWEEAVDYLQEAHGLFKKGGNQRELALTECHLAQVELGRGDFAQARKYLDSAMKGILPIFPVPALLKIISEYCFLNAAEGKPEIALAFGLFVMAHPATEWEDREAIREPLAKWQALLGPDQTALIQEGAKNIQIREAADTLLKG